MPCETAQMQRQMKYTQPDVRHQRRLRQRRVQKFVFARFSTKVFNSNLTIGGQGKSPFTEVSR